MIKMRRAKDTLRDNPWIKAFIYGENGTGKTTWAARSPRPLIVLTEPQGQASIENANPEALVVTIKTYAAFKEVWQAVVQGVPVKLDNGQPALRITLGGETAEIQTIVLDSFTDLQRMMKNALEGAEGDTSASVDLDDDSRGEMPKTGWGRLVSVCEVILREQRSLSLNVIFLALAKEEIDDSNRRTVRPSLYGQLATQVGQYFNAQGYLAKVLRGHDVQYRLCFVMPNTHTTKPAPGYPNNLVVTQEPGVGTLGSLNMHVHRHKPDLLVAAEDTDSADLIEAGQAATTTPREEGARQSAQAAESNDKAGDAPKRKVGMGARRKA